jgi:dGTP triphosphohydrolase
MTLAPSANSSVELLTGELKQFNNEDELYSYLDQLSHDVDGVSFLDKAKAAVNAWWVRVIVGIANADRFYGFDTNAGASFNKSAAMGERLWSWCRSVGLDDKSKLNSARTAARTWLSVQNKSCFDLVNDYGINKLVQVGRAPQEHRERLLTEAGSKSTKQLAKEVSTLNSSKEQLQIKLEKAYEELDKRNAKLDALKAAGTASSEMGGAYNAVNRAKATIEKLEEKISSLKKSAPSQKEGEDERIYSAEKEAAAAKAKAEALEAELKTLKENTPEPVVVDEKAIQDAALKVANETAELKIKLAQEAAEKAQKDAVAKALADYKAEQQKLKDAEEKAAKEAAKDKKLKEDAAREKAVKEALDAYKNGELAKLSADPSAIKQGKIMLGSDILGFKRAAERLFHFRCLPDDTLPSVFQLELDAVEAMGQWFESLSDENLVVVQQLLDATVSGRKVSTSIHSIHDNLVTIDV